MTVRALVVDDQPVVRGNLRLRLERLGCVVAEAEHAAQGLEVFLLRDIRRAGGETDVVVISSKTQDRDEFLREGAIEFLAKPFENFGSLVRKLEPLIQSIAAGTGPST